jgi:hypothetical protein
MKMKVSNMNLNPNTTIAIGIPNMISNITPETNTGQTSGQK